MAKVYALCIPLAFLLVLLTTILVISFSRAPSISPPVSPPVFPPPFPPLFPPPSPPTRKDVTPLNGPPTPLIVNEGYPPNLVNESQDTWATFAEQYQLWVGPLRFNYKYGGNDVSVSGRPPAVYFHTTNTDLAFVRGRTLHEYIHLVQMAYGAESYVTEGGGRNENWHYDGPRWWSEGSAEWTVCVYGIALGIEMDCQGHRACEYYADAVQSCNRIQGVGKVTIRHVLSPNLNMNPEWEAVDRCGIYGSHVYQGGLCAVSFAMDFDHTSGGLERLLSVFKSVAQKDDWEQAFLSALTYDSMREFYDAFDAYVL